jgi:hypothetical protein
MYKHEMKEFNLQKNVSYSSYMLQDSMMTFMYCKHMGRIQFLLNEIDNNHSQYIYARDNSWALFL